MNGRQEHQKMLETKINNILSGQQYYMRDFANCFGDKTINTKYRYLKYVVDFLTYLNDELGIDISNPENLSSIKTSTINGYSEHIHYRVECKNGIESTIENGAGIRASRLYAISYFFDFLKDDGYINVNPCDTKKFPKEKREIDVVAMNMREVNILKRNIMDGVGTSKARKRQAIWKTRDFAIITLALVTGLRVEALCEINLSDINFDELSISVIEKGNIKKEKFIGENTLDILNEWIVDRDVILGDENNDALFISSIKKDGKHLRFTSNGVRSLMKKYTKGIDKNITPHKLRSTCATTLYKKTEDIYLVADVLGHKNLQNTRRYAYVGKDSRQDAARKLDGLFSR